MWQGTLDTEGGNPDSGHTDRLDPRVFDGARLVVLVLDQSGVAVHPLPPAGRVTVGRQGTDITIPHAWISRRHATIHLDSPPRIEDLGSANGIVVAGRRLAPNETAPLAPGVGVELGRTMLLLQRLPGPRDGLRSPPGGPAVSASGMTEVWRIVERVAGSTLSVLLAGETGVGKERLAERIHRLSPRAQGAFLRLNCAALPETLLESELFGHERGAFTGATAVKPGLLEVASGGTVFLDEIGELPPALQVKLLRVFEERHVFRVGALGPSPIDVRFVSATNRDIDREAETGRFRRDLYYRLNGITIRVPPLRERVTEIRGLAETFLGAAREAAGLGPAALSLRALAVLEGHPWHGNIRELKNAMERAALFCSEGTIVPEHLQLERPELPVPDGTRSLQDDVAAVEKQRILDALTRCGGNQSRAAKVLDISRNTLMAKMSHYGITRPRKS